MIRRSSGARAIAGMRKSARNRDPFPPEFVVPQALINYWVGQVGSGAVSSALDDVGILAVLIQEEENAQSEYHDAHERGPDDRQPVHVAVAEQRSAQTGKIVECAGA